MIIVDVSLQPMDDSNQYFCLGEFDPGKPEASQKVRLSLDP